MLNMTMISMLPSELRRKRMPKIEIKFHDERKSLLEKIKGAVTPEKWNLARIREYGSDPLVKNGWQKAVIYEGQEGKYFFKLVMESNGEIGVMITEEFNNGNQLVFKGKETDFINLVRALNKPFELLEDLQREKI